MVKLKQEFLDRMKKQLKDGYDGFIKSYDKESVRGVRINTKKVSVEDFLKITPFNCESINYCDNGFIVDSEEKWGKHPYHHAGLIYFQEPSSMIPVCSVEINEDDYVIDLCAAPGGKSGQIACELGDNGLLISNEIVTSRSKILFSNIERQGFKNVVVTNNTPTQLADKFGACFDKVFVDAPCSGEGMFRKDNNAINEWTEQATFSNANRQLLILEDAKKLVKRGGKLIYSTCTFSSVEDEGVVKEFLKENNNFKLISLSEKVLPFVVCEDENKLTGKFYPHLAKGEGQFVAVFEKFDGDEEQLKTLRIQKLYKSEEILFNEFVKQNLNVNLIAYSLNDSLYILPKVCPDLRGLNIISAGVKAGEVIKNRFAPFHSLFNAYGDVFKRKLNLSLNDKRVGQYLKGEEIECDLDNKYAVIQVDGFNLGGVKVSEGRAKNLYPKGLRD